MASINPANTSQSLVLRGDKPSPAGELICDHCGKKYSGQINESLKNYCCNGCQALDQAQLPSATTQFEFWDERAPQNEVAIYVEGVHCAACVTVLEQIPEKLPEDVVSSILDFSHAILKIRLAPNAKLSRVAHYIVQLGYRPHLLSEASERFAYRSAENRKLLIELGIAGALSGNIMLMSIPLYSGASGSFEKMFEWICFALATPSLFYSGRSFLKNTWHAFKNKSFSIDAPIALALLVAYFYSLYSLIQNTHELYFDSLSGLIFLLLSSRYLLLRIRQSSTLNLSSFFIDPKPFLGRVGDSVALQNGQSLAFDGVVRKGFVFVDTSKFTGESEPVQLNVGDSIFAGTEIIESSPDHIVEVLQVHPHTRIMKLFQKAEEFMHKKSNTSIFSDKLAKWLLVFISCLGFVLLAGMYLRGEFTEGLNRFLALLIVTCPCALALATPLVFVMASRKMLEQGIMVKDPQGLDAAMNINKVCFDKTGTLTYGKLELTRTDANLSENQWGILLGLCLKSRHPVSRAVVRYIQTQYPSIEGALIQDFQEIAGKGLRGFHNEKEFRFEQNRFYYVHSNQSEFTLCRFEFADKIRQGVRPLISELQSQGLKTFVLTGDTLENAQKVLAGVPGLKILAKLSPEEKANHVLDALMVGDGINDSLSLSKAKVSIAVQGGMEAAVQSSQIFLTQGGVEKIPLILSFAKKVKRALTLNFMISTAYNLLGATLAITGILNPLIAAIMMPLSALSVFSFTYFYFNYQKSAPALEEKA